ncbi:FABP family protein [Nocardia cyriacigeorgica]|uniref:peroxynitrite isomerase n=1 Tax=Nocardia cyriacigeorgica TaxID=135487 RepID=UPI0018943114|nr:FABP family protein [Nocardia cyriacigeorgica]MBF6097183.1 FABP family protein [Nocardia cyriacigeorgica]MBF6158658.1 FABP family protein [Nocardia cyriacigeorgica]MBF6197654.1 FABP family protein [Nocardia cyriacigeorgica]MBF6316520.1 FABP family protein [Nocardia cyriacigeorgica]MBF6344944.1 FABP family protein [Nocardia cyriacigeorgica]
MVEPQPPVAPHPDIAPLAPLLGTWRGEGHGEYPTIEPFDYLEEIHFGHIGRPFLTYRQRTRAADDNRPLHAETGYLRCPRPDRVELILAHPTGITEICEGILTVSADEIHFEFESTNIGLTSTAKSVTALGRSIRQSGDVIDYTLRMAAVGEPLRHHLAATLRRA